MNIDALNGKCEDLQFMYLTDISRDRIILSDSSQRIIHANESFLSSFHHKLSSLRNTEFISIFSKNSQEDLHAAICDTHPLATQDKGPLYLINGHGKEVPVNVRLTRYEISGESILVSVFDDRSKQIHTRYHDLYKMLRLMCDNVPDLIWAKDRGKRFIFVNKATCEKLLNAADTDEPIGKTDMFFADREKNSHNKNPQWHTFGKICCESDSVVMKTGKPERFNEFGNVRGKLLQLDVYKAPLFNDQGEMIGVVGCGRDVTQEKIIEEKLRQSERRYRLIVEDQTELICRFLQDKILTFVNEAFCRYFGKDREELIGKTFTPLVFEEDKKFVNDTISQLTYDNPSVTYEHRVLSKNADIRWVQWSDRAIYGDKGELIEYQGVGRDITTLKETKMALKKANESLEKKVMERTAELEFEIEKRSTSDIRFRTAIETLPFDFFMIDKDNRYIMQNRYSKKLWGTDVVGLRAQDVDVSNDIKAIWENNNRLAFSGKTISDEVTYEINGEKLYFKNIMAPVNSGGEPEAIIGMNIDITDHKKTIEHLHHTIFEFVAALDAMLEKKDPYTSGHQKRVAAISRAIAGEIGLPEDKITGIYIAARIHDIGKISIPSEILTKKSKLSDSELELLKEHPDTAYDILKNLNFPWPIAEIIRQHHERMDGSGYPRGIKGENIMLEARILGVSDVVEAMASHRPYRAALGIDNALEEIRKNSEVLYDPNIVAICLEIFKKDKLTLFKFNSEVMQL